MRKCEVRYENPSTLVSSAHVHRLALMSRLSTTHQRESALKSSSMRVTTVRCHVVARSNISLIQTLRSLVPSSPKVHMLVEVPNEHRHRCACRRQNL